MYEYTLSELAETSGLPERTLRLYRTKGLLDAPVVRGRVGHYTIEHLTQLRLVKALTDRGFPLAVIADMLSTKGMRPELIRMIATSGPRAEFEEHSPTYLDADAVSELKRRAPGVYEELANIGIIRIDGTGTYADALALSLIGDLLLEGLDATTIATFALHIARAADEAGKEIQKHLANEALDETLHPALIDAATVVFRETLSRRARR